MFPPDLVTELVAARTERRRHDARVQRMLVDARPIRPRLRLPWTDWQVRSPVVRRPCPGPPAFTR